MLTNDFVSFEQLGPGVIKRLWCMILKRWLSIKRNEPPRGKTNNVVSELVRHKPACTATEDG